MGINRYAPHVQVLPEDDANRQLANGFQLHPALNCSNICVAPPCGGWSKVVDDFEAEQIKALRKFEHRHLVMMIDFDDQFDTRFAQIRARIPNDLAHRVYVLGAQREPEHLKGAVNLSLERIGDTLANECAGSGEDLWNHEMLRHNSGELNRLVANVKPFLFKRSSV